MMDILIKDVKSGMKNLNVQFIVLDVGPPITTKDNRELRSCKVADHTAAINVSIWDEPSQYVCPGDIIKITRGYTSLFRDCLTLYVGKSGEIQKVGEFSMIFNEQLDMSAPNPSQNAVSTPYAPNSVLANSNGPSSAPINNGARTPAGAPSLSPHKPQPLKNASSSVVYNSNSEGSNKNQPGRSNSRGRGSGTRR